MRLKYLSWIFVLLFLVVSVSAISPYGVIANWHMVETTTILDSLGVFNSTSNSGVRITGPFSYAQNYSGVAGSNTTFSTSDLLNMSAGYNRSICAWIYTSNTSQSGTYLGKGYNWGIGQFQGKPVFLYYPGTDQIYVASSATWLNNTWQFVCYTYTVGNGSSMKVYVNGTLASGSWVYGTGNASPPASTSPFIVGYGPYNGAFNGGVAEITYFNYTLTSQNITDMLNNIYPFMQYNIFGTIYYNSVSFVNASVQLMNSFGGYISSTVSNSSGGYVFNTGLTNATLYKVMAFFDNSSVNYIKADNIYTTTYNNSLNLDFFTQSSCAVDLGSAFFYPNGCNIP